MYRTPHTANHKNYHDTMNCNLVLKPVTDWQLQQAQSQVQSQSQVLSESQVLLSQVLSVLPAVWPGPGKQQLLVAPASLPPRYHYKICEGRVSPVRTGRAGSASLGIGAGMEMFNRFRFKGETQIQY